MADKDIDLSIFTETVEYALDYLEELAKEGRYTENDIQPPRWVGSVCTANGIGAVLFETRSKDDSVRGVLDGLLGYVEIMASLSGLTMCCVENPQTKRVFIFHPSLISKESLERGRYYSYTVADRASLKR